MILTQALWRQKATKPQYGLSRAERRENLLGSFAFHPVKLDGTVIVIDDIATTGASLEEAARPSSKKAGRKKVVDSSLPVMRPWRPFPIWTDGKEFKLIGSLSSRLRLYARCLGTRFLQNGSVPLGSRVIHLKIEPYQIDMTLFFMGRQSNLPTRKHLSINGRGGRFFGL